VSTKLFSSASSLLLCCAFLLRQPSESQMPAPLGKLNITSTTPGASITINDKQRNERTPVTLAVVPGTYKVIIGTCSVQSVTVRSGETQVVNCEK